MILTINPTLRLMLDGKKQYVLQRATKDVGQWESLAYILNPNFLRAVLSRPSLGIPDRHLAELLDKLPPGGNAKADEEFARNMRMRG